MPLHHGHVGHGWRTEPETEPTTDDAAASHALGSVTRGTVSWRHRAAHGSSRNARSIYHTRCRPTAKATR